MRVAAEVIGQKADFSEEAEKFKSLPYLTLKEAAQAIDISIETLRRYRNELRNALPDSDFPDRGRSSSLDAKSFRAIRQFHYLWKQRRLTKNAALTHLRIYGVS